MPLICPYPLAMPDGFASGLQLPFICVIAAHTGTSVHVSSEALKFIVAFIASASDAWPRFDLLGVRVVVQIVTGLVRLADSGLWDLIFLFGFSFSVSLAGLLVSWRRPES